MHERGIWLRNKKEFHSAHEIADAIRIDMRFKPARGQHKRSEEKKKLVFMHIGEYTFSLLSSAVMCDGHPTISLSHCYFFLLFMPVTLSAPLSHESHEKLLIAGRECHSLWKLFGPWRIWATVWAEDRNNASVGAGRRIIMHPIIRNFNALSLRGSLQGPRQFVIMYGTSSNPGTSNRGSTVECWRKNRDGTGAIAHHSYLAWAGTVQIGPHLSQYTFEGCPFSKFWYSNMAEQ